MAIGDIGAVLGTFEFEPDVAKYTHIIHIDGDVYAIAYEHANAEARVETVRIPSDGKLIDPHIDNLLLHESRGKATRIQWVRGNIYAIASRDDQFRPMLTTVEIFPNGQITDTIKDSWAWHTISKTWHPWALRTAGILALAFGGTGDDGWLYTIRIDTEGLITKSVDYWLEFDEANARPGHIAEVVPGIYAIAYLGSAAAGIIKTFSQSILGNLSAAPLSDHTFDAVRGFSPWLTRAHEGIYAIPYQGPDNYGKICTVKISDTGTITVSGFDPKNFNTAYCDKPSSVICGGNLLAIAYTGPDLDGFLTTVQIADTGEIASGPYPTIEFDTGNCFEPSIIRIAGNVYAIAYSGADDDGYLKTVSIESPIERPPDHSLLVGIGP